MPVSLCGDIIISVLKFCRSVGMYYIRELDYYDKTCIQTNVSGRDGYRGYQ